MPIKVDLDGDEEIFLDNAEIDVTPSGTIYFNFEGTISNIDNSILQELTGKSVKPTQIVFERK